MNFTLAVLDEYGATSFKWLSDACGSITLESMRAALDNLLLAARRSVFYWPFRFTIGFFSPGNWKKGFDKSIEWIDEALALMMFIPLAYGAFIAVSVLVHVLFNTAGVPFLTRLANSGPDWVLSLAESQYTDIAQRARGHLEAARKYVASKLSPAGLLLFYGNLQKSQVFDAVEQLNSVEDIATPVSAWGHFKRTRLKTRRVKTGAPVAVPVPVAVVSVKAERVIQDIVRERCVALDAPGGKDECTLLHYLVRPGSGDTSAARLRCVEFLVEHSARIVADLEGNTPLHVAARSGDAGAAFLEVLLKAKDADVNAANKLGSTPLHLAAAAGSVHALDLLLRHQGANVNVAHGLDGSAPLHWAARAGHINAVGVLIDDFNASVHRVNKSGTTALHLSVRGNHLACVRKLIAAESEVLAELWDGRTPHNLARSEDVRKLLGSAPERSNLGPKALAAVQAKDLLRQALQDAARGSGISKTSSDCLEAIVGLLKQGAPAEPDRVGRSPLHFVVLGCPHATGDSPDGRVRAIRALLEGSVDIMIDAKSDGDSTALHWAAQFGHAASVKALLESGADVGAVTTAGDTPLHLSANQECAMELLSHKADPSSRNEAKQTPEDCCLVAKSLIGAKRKEMEEKKMAAFSKSGIKLSRIVAFVNIDTSLKKLEAEEGPYSSWRFGQDVVKKATDGKRAFVDNALLCDPQSAGPAAVFVCHAHKNRFQVLVDTLGDHFRKEEPCLWVDLFCMNQHDEEYRLDPSDSAKFIKDTSELKRMVVVMDPWREPHVLSRLWCLWEIANADKKKKQIEFVLSEAERKSFVAALWDEVDPDLSGGIQKVLSHIRGLDSRNAAARSAQDEVLIKKQIEKSLGGYETLNATVSRIFRLLLEKYGEQELSEQRSNLSKGKKEKLADLLNVLGNMYYDHGKLCAAQRHYTEARDIRDDLLEKARKKRQPSAEHEEIKRKLAEARLQAMNNLANILKDNRQREDGGTALSPGERQAAVKRAQELYKEVLAERTANEKEGSKERIRALNNLGALSAMREVVIDLSTEDGRQRLAYARGMLDSALEQRLLHPELGPGHKDTLMSQEGLATLLCDWAGGDEARMRAGVRMWRAVIAGRVKCPAIGDRHRRTFVARAGLGKALMALREMEEASELLQGAVDGLKEIGAVPGSDPDLLDAESALRAVIKGGGCW